MRRRGFCALTAAAVAGCLQLQEEPADGSDEDAESDETDDSAAGNGDDDQSIDEDAESLELVEAWTLDVDRMSGIDGNFIGSVRPPHSDAVETARVERYDDDGEPVWYSDEIDDGYSYELTTHSGGGVRSTNGTIIVAATGGPDVDDARLYAYDADTGEQQWVHETEAERLETYFRALTVHDGTLYYGVTDSGGTDDDQNPTVRALDIADGTVRWEETFEEGFFSGAIAVGDRLYLGGTWELHVFDAETGEHLREEDSSIGFDGFAPVEDEELLYLGQSDLQAYDLAADELGWERELSRGFDAGITYDDGMIYGGTNSGWVIARDGTDGDLEWETRIEGSVREPIIADDGIVWVRNMDHDLYAINAATGDVLEERDGGHPDRIAPANGLVFLDDTAYELNGVEE